MKKFTLSMLLLGAAFSMNAQQEYVIFEDDFSWLLPWANALNANGQACGDPIGKNDVSDNVSVSRALSNIKIDVNGTEVSADQAMTNKGYDLLINWSTKIKDNDGKLIVYDSHEPGWAVFLQRELNQNDEAVGTYLKFGRQNYSAGLTTPALEKAGSDGVTGFTVSFDWTPQRQGTATAAYDKTHLAVYVGDGTASGSRINLEDHNIANGSKLEWHHVNVKFDNYTLKSTDKITIRPGAQQWPETKKDQSFRFYLKNLRITTTTPIATGVADIEVEDNAPVEYYNLQGIRVAEPENGLYIVRQGNKVTKKFIRK